MVFRKEFGKPRPRGIKPPLRLLTYESRQNLHNRRVVILGISRNPLQGINASQSYRKVVFTKLVNRLVVYPAAADNPIGAKTG